MKRKTAKFIQIISHASLLAALDEDGQIWQLSPTPTGCGTYRWYRVENKRELYSQDS